MKSNVGNVVESELFVLTALMLIDDLSEAYTRISELQKAQEQNNISSPSPQRVAQAAPPLLAEGQLEQTTRRIEQLAKLFETG